MSQSKVRQLFDFKRFEIARLFKTAKRVARFAAFDFLASPAAGSYGRLLVVASAKTGNAPERNTLKRRLRALFYEEKLFERGYDCIVILKVDAKKLTFDQLKELFLKSFALLVRHEKVSTHETV